MSSNYWGFMPHIDPMTGYARNLTTVPQDNFEQFQQNVLVDRLTQQMQMANLQGGFDVYGPNPAMMAFAQQIGQHGQRANDIYNAAMAQLHGGGQAGHGAPAGGHGPAPQAGPSAVHSTVGGAVLGAGGAALVGSRIGAFAGWAGVALGAGIGAVVGFIRSWF